MTTPTTPPDAVMPPLPVVAYRHTLHMELNQKQSRFSEFKASAFGMPGRDYSEEYLITTEPLCKVSDAQAYAAQRTAELEAKLAAAEKRVAELTSENANLLHALKAELQGQTFMGEPFIPALTPKEQS